MQRESAKGKRIPKSDEKTKTKRGSPDTEKRAKTKHSSKEGIVSKEPKTATTEAISVTTTAETSHTKIDPTITEFQCATCEEIVPVCECVVFIESAENAMVLCQTCFEGSPIRERAKNNVYTLKKKGADGKVMTETY